MEGLDPKILARLKEKIQKELAQRERETVEYWLNELLKVYQKNHQTLAEFKAEIRQYIDRMKNRLEVLKTRGY
jgi:siroheme synthase (precorrin-2 oxidase/ferrochelatase)